MDKNRVKTGADLARRWRVVAGAVLVCGAAAAAISCGSGSGGDTSVTPLPATLAPLLPQGLQQSGQAVNFQAAVADPVQKLRYAWQFGDGSSSTLANPSHAYAVPGVYAVLLTVTNEAGETRTVQSSVSIADLALAQGLQCSGPASATNGWCWQRPLPQGNPVLDISLTAAGTGWAVGEAGTVLLTTNSGATWQHQDAPVTQDLVRVVAVDTQVAWAASNSGTVLTTSNGGSTWHANSPAGVNNLVALGANSANNAWVLTAAGARWSTSDGGTTWASTVRPADVAGSVLSTGDGGVWVIPTYGTRGEGYDAGMHYTRSANNGSSWTTGAMPTLAVGLSRNVWSAQAASASVAMMLTTDAGIDNSTDQLVRSTRAWRTLDGGQSWNTFNRAPLDDATLGVGYQMRSASLLLCVSAGKGLNISSDGGDTWSDLPLPAGLGSAGDSFTRAQLLGTAAETGPARLLLHTQRGRRFYSANSGALWTELSPSGGAQQAALAGLWFFDRREGLASGADGSTLRTLDGGRTWAAQTQTGAPVTLRFVPGSDAGWAVSATGTLLRTADRGRSWTAPSALLTSQLAGLRDVHFVDNQRGWAVTSPGTAPGAVWRSSDGGQSWQGSSGTGAAAAAFTGLTAVRFAADGQSGLAAGAQGQILASSDGGVTWTAVASGVNTPLRALAWLADGTTALAVGTEGVVLRSTDRGRNWQRINTPSAVALHALNALSFSSALRGWAVGDGGTLLRTLDGGLTWTAQNSGTRANLTALHASDDQTAWVSGANGSVLVTISGGE